MPPVTSHPSRELSEPGWSVDTAEGVSTSQPPRELYRRLKFIAGLFKEAGNLPVPGPYLLWRDGEGKVHHRLIDRDLIIGRAADCDIMLEDLRASRRHCHLTPSKGAILLEDLGSTHGTKVGFRLQYPKVLRNGDVIEAGGAALVFFTFVKNDIPHG